MNQLAVDKYGRFNPILAKVMVKEAYDIEFGLYDHDDPKLQHPLQYHLWTEKLSVKKHGLFRIYMDKYHVHQIQKYFGISYLEFINLPADEFDNMLEMSNFISEREEKEREAAQNNIEQKMAKAEIQPQNTFTGEYRP